MPANQQPIAEFTFLLSCGSKKLAISSCNAQEAFPAWDSVLQRAGSFPGLGFRPAMRRKLSRLAISSCNAQEAFRGLRFRPATRRKELHPI
ncbi:hypothetical protein B5F91_05945 [Bacteroides sp. An322]|nr:hypothetical protein B5F91_05945 [Bacteroides sp. An322]